jgi:hypothetical protein
MAVDIVLESVGNFQFEFMVISNCSFGLRSSFIDKVLLLIKLYCFRKWPVKYWDSKLLQRIFSGKCSFQMCHSIMREWKQFCFYFALSSPIYCADGSCYALTLRPPVNTHQSYGVARLRDHQKLVTWCAVLWHERLFIRRSNCDQLPHIEMDCVYEFEPQNHIASDGSILRVFQMN